MHYLIFRYSIWIAILFNLCYSDPECDFPNAVYTIPGDVAFMGIFNLHAGDNCSIENSLEFDTVQNVIQTIRRLNILRSIAPDVEIGINIYDACSANMKAEKAIVNALFDMECSHTYSLGLLTTHNVSTALASIINHLHLPQVVLNNEYVLNLELLFNASFSFLQSVRMTTIHVAILPKMDFVDTFANLATTYRLCVNNPMAYNYVEDSKDKIIPNHSEYAIAVFVGTLQDYPKYSQYITSMCKNVLFIPTKVVPMYSENYFKDFTNGTFIISPYTYNSDETLDKDFPIIPTNDQEHPFIQKLNQFHEFNINMKFVQNSLKIFQNINMFKAKFNDECNGKNIKNCTDLKPVKIEIKSTEERIPFSMNVNNFINSFQVDNEQTSINGMNIYRVYNTKHHTEKKIENEQNEESSVVGITTVVKYNQDSIEKDKKKLLMDINNTNFENIEKRDLILNSIHIVTSEKYDDLLRIEENEDKYDEDNDDFDKTKYEHKMDKRPEIQSQDNVLNDGENIENVKTTTQLFEVDNTPGNASEVMEIYETNEINKTTLDLHNETQMNNVSEINNTKQMDDEAINKSDDTVIKHILIKSREDRLKDILSTNIGHNDNQTFDSQKNNSSLNLNQHLINRKIRDIKEHESMNKVEKLESIAKYNYANNSWIILIEDDDLQEGNEEYLCKIITEFSQIDNNTEEEIGKDCSECFNFREIYQIIQLNKQEFEESKKKILDIIFKISLKSDSFVVSIISLSVIGLISCFVILTFIAYRILKRDVLEGNPTITILLLLSIIYNYFAILPFVFNVNENIENFEYYSSLMCYIRLIAIITSFNFIFSLLLTRCLMLSFCDHDGALMSHINGYVQSSFCFFITIIQILFLINLFLIKYIFNLEIKCDTIESNYIFMLGYNIILLFLLLLTIPFIYRCKRNYFEGVYLTMAIISIVFAWSIWIYLYVEYNYSESMLILGIYVTSTILLIVIFIPRTYHMITNIVRDNITSILPALSSQYNTGSIHNIHYRSTQALYDIVNDAENKQLGEINPYYLSSKRQESRLRPKSPYYTSRNPNELEQPGELSGLENSFLRQGVNENDNISLYNDEPGRISSVSTRIRSHSRHSPSFKGRVRSPSIKSRANSPPQLDDLYDTSRYDTPSTMTRF